MARVRAHFAASLDTRFFRCVLLFALTLAFAASATRPAQAQRPEMLFPKQPTQRPAPVKPHTSSPTVVPAANWVQAFPATSPTARTESAMAYDGANSTALLFGGFRLTDGYLGDTWAWNGTTWIQQSTATSPSARCGHMMSYDAANGTVVLFGGIAGTVFSNSLMSDTWTWNGTAWTQQSPGTSPPARLSGAMAYDAANGTVVLFGGSTAGSTLLSDTWTWNGTTWTQQFPSSSPSARETPTMAYDAATGQVVLFGGDNGNPLADTWTYNGTTWTQQSPAISPTARSDAAMTYDEATTNIVLYGGETSAVVLADTWTWNGTAWMQQSPITGPSARTDPSMTYDAATGSVVLFGGCCTTVPFDQTDLNDTWNYVAGPPTIANTAVGSSTTSTATFTFTAGGSIGAPVVLTQGAPNLDFTDAGTGTCTTNGTSHVYAVGDTCTVDVNFAPKYPGQRLGAIEITSTTGTVLYTELISGTGTGPLATFTPGTISTVAGSGTEGYTAAQDGGPATSANLSYITGVAVDGTGNLYIADFNNYRIRKVSAATGIITTVAGNGTAGVGGDGGAATSAELYYPAGVAVDGAGNLYIADQGFNLIRKVTAATGIISTLAGTTTPGYVASQDGGPATSAELNHPAGLTVDGAGNIYIADYDNYRIRKITAATGIISTVAGNGTQCTTSATTGCADSGPATSAELNDPNGVAVDGAGNFYIADRNNMRIRKVTVATGIITTVSGTGTAGYVVSQDGGPATSAELNYPDGVAVDGAGNLYIADNYNNRIRKVSAATGTITTVAGYGNVCVTSTEACGDGGAASSAKLNDPDGVAVDSAGNLYIADQYDSRIRKVSIKAGINFPTATTAGSADSTDGTETATLNNVGNASLTIASMANTTSGNFVLGNPNTGGCSTSVAAGGSCLLGETFSPATGSTGLVTGSLAITDNSLNASTAVQHVPLIGNVTAGTVSAEIFGTTVTHGAASTTLTLVFGYGGTAADTGAITVTVNGSAAGVGTPTCTSKPGHMNCVYPYTGTALATPGSYPLAVSVAASSPYLAGSGTGTLSVQ